MSMKRTCIVSGGAGFIGSHLADRLIAEGYRVVVIDNLSAGSKNNLNPKAKFYKLDIQSPQIQSVFQREKPSALFHYAAQIDVRKSVQDPLQDARVNILGSLNLLESCRKYGVEKAIFASTGGAIYGDADVMPTPESYPAKPVSPYGIAKLSVEHYLHYYQVVHGLEYVALRFGNVYGPRQNSKGEAGVVAIFTDALLLKRQPVIYGSGRQTRDFIFVADVVEANILALRKKKTGIFNIGTGKETSVNRIFQILKQHARSLTKKVHVPAKKGELARSSLDCSKARKELEWSHQYDLRQGLQKTADWFQNYGVKR